MALELDQEKVATVCRISISSPRKELASVTMPRAVGFLYRAPSQLEKQLSASRLEMAKHLLEHYDLEHPGALNTPEGMSLVAELQRLTRMAQEQLHEQREKKRKHRELLAQGKQALDRDRRETIEAKHQIVGRPSLAPRLRAAATAVLNVNRMTRMASQAEPEPERGS